MGFPTDWKLPLGSRAGLRAAGNAVPPPMARAVMSCAVAAARSAPPPAQEPAPPEPAPPERERPASDELAGLRRKLRRLAKRVDVLEGHERGTLDD